MKKHKLKENEKIVNIIYEKISGVNVKKMIITILVISIIIIKILFPMSMSFFGKKYVVDTNNISKKNSNNQSEKVNENSEFEFQKKEKNNMESRKNMNSKVVVYITGAVANPGVICIEGDKRLDDVIKKAGGLTKDADFERINLAMSIEDSQHYIIPYKDENKNISSSDSVKQGEDSKSVDSGVCNSSNSGDSSKVGINTSDQSKLETIPGVGPSTARKIIDYREKNGKFNTLEDIKNVSGIGEKKFDNMKDYISLN